MSENKKEILNTQFHLGQLVSLGKDAVEYMHGGGKPEVQKNDADRKGWQNSEIVMFPIISTADKHSQEVQELYSHLGQHGISRALGWRGGNAKIVIEDAESQIITQRYKRGTTLRNPKYEFGTSNPETLSMNNDFEITKIYTSNADTLRFSLRVQNLDARVLSYQVGWHPAFSTLGDPKKGVFEANGKKFTLKDVAKTTQKLRDIENILYFNEETGYQIDLKSRGFGNLMIWTPDIDSGMFCIEPVTHLPGMSKLIPLKRIEEFGTDNYDVIIKL